MERQQTLKWFEFVPKDKVNVSKLKLTFDKNGKPKFIPKHLSV
jgi:hypothetical protein